VRPIEVLMTIAEGDRKRGSVLQPRPGIHGGGDVPTNQPRCKISKTAPGNAENLAP
jgi:hypothetical protein